MLYILTAIFLWSSLGIIIRLSGMPVHLLMFFSSVVSFSIIGLMFLKSEFRKELHGGKGVVHLASLGLISLVNTFSFFYAYKNTSIANAVLTHYTAPVIVAFIAPIFLKERLTFRVLLAVAVASAGLWIMLGISAQEFFGLLTAGDKNTAGIFAGLFSGFAYAVLIVAIRILSQNFNPIVMAFFQNLFIAAVLSPFIKLPDNFHSALWAFGIMGIVHSTIAPILYFKGMRYVTANKTAIIGYLEPVCAILLGFVLLGEAIDYKTAIGGGMILVSGYLTIRHV
ncbi:MAG: EamA family transporter [Thermodesulfovibrionales bacterium]|nr:EamA family transporter [Thermodesulfovibrionales bacterium]